VDYQTILFDVGADKVATITLNRPEAMNSFNAQMTREFVHLWKRISEDDNINAVVLRASDCRAFSTGADIKQSREDENVLGSTFDFNMQDPGEFLGPKANRCWKPVVTAVHGLCCGGAFYFLNESDIIICAEDSQFFDPHVDYGLACCVEPIGLSYRMAIGDVMRIALLGNAERMSAKTALEARLVSEVHPTREALWQRAHYLAATIAARPTEAVQGSVYSIWASMDQGRKVALEQGFRHCLIVAPGGKSKLDHQALMKNAKREFEVR
jgi:enoyl-CoA hydratase/carnithine racemase